MSKPKIPDAVLAQVSQNEIATYARLVRVRDELERTIVTTTRSRVLRGLRTQLEEQHAAWTWILGQALSGPGESETSGRCPECEHVHRGRACGEFHCLCRVVHA